MLFAVKLFPGTIRSYEFSGIKKMSNMNEVENIPGEMKSLRPLQTVGDSENKSSKPAKSNYKFKNNFQNKIEMAFASQNQPNRRIKKKKKMKTPEGFT